MKVIAGLGNPGAEYAATRHNVGFMLADLLAGEGNLSFRPKFQAFAAEGSIEGERVLVLKPQTFMNLSGRAVREATGFYKVPSQDVLIVHDDMDLALGRLRLRAQGSAGGHNGIRSVIAELGTEEFWRLKLGVERPPAEWDPARYVLAPFSKEEMPVLREMLERAHQAALLWLKGDGVKAMNLYNR